MPGPPPEAAQTRERPRRPPLLALIAVVLLAFAAVIVGLALVLAGDASAETRIFEGTTDATVASDPGPRMTILGLLKAKPTGPMSAIITREVDALSTPGGPPVNLRLHIVFSQPEGSFTADLVGTVQVTNKGAEVVRGAATVSDGTGDYDGISGAFNLIGDNPPGTQISRFIIRGTLEY